MSWRELGVGPEVDDDRSGGVEPLQRALGAAEVDLLHISAMGLVAQTTAGERLICNARNNGADQLTTTRKVGLCEIATATRSNLNFNQTCPNARN